MLLQPTYTYKFSPLIGAGVSGIYQKRQLHRPVLRITPTSTITRATLNSTGHSPRDRNLSFGGFGSKYQATQIESSATGSGAHDGSGYELDAAAVDQASRLIYQHTNIDQMHSIPCDRRREHVGRQVERSLQDQLSQYRADLSRFVIPRAAGACMSTTRRSFNTIEN